MPQPHGLNETSQATFHAASSTARLAASSIVGSPPRFWAPAPGEGLGRGPLERAGAFPRIRPVEPNDDRVVDRHLLEGSEDPACDLVAAGDAAEDIEGDRITLRTCGGTGRD